MAVVRMISAVRMHYGGRQVSRGELFYVKEKDVDVLKHMRWADVAKEDDKVNEEDNTEEVDDMGAKKDGKKQKTPPPKPDTRRKRTYKRRDMTAEKP